MARWLYLAGQGMNITRRYVIRVPPPRHHHQANHENHTPAPPAILLGLAAARRAVVEAVCEGHSGPVSRASQGRHTVKLIQLVMATWYRITGVGGMEDSAT